MDEIKKYINKTSFSTSANAHLSNSNCPKLPSNISLLSQDVNANESDLSSGKSIASSETDLDFDQGADVIDLAIDVAGDCLSLKNKNKSSQIDATKRAKYSNKIFDYIHITQYQKLFFKLGIMT